MRDGGGGESRHTEDVRTHGMIQPMYAIIYLYAIAGDANDPTPRAGGR